MIKKNSLHARKKILVSIFSVLILSLLFPLFSKQENARAQTGVTPTFGCMGSPSSICPTTQVSPSSLTPSSTEPNPTGSNGNGGTTTPAPSSSIAPCEQGTVSVQHRNGKKKHKKKRNGSIGNGMLQLLQLLIDFLNRLLQLIGGGNGQIPSPQQPGDPCPPDGQNPDDGDPGDQEPSPTSVVPSGSVPSTTTAPSVAPSGTTGTNPSGEAMPKGDISGWKQIFADDFTTNVPLGAFSNCNNNTDTPQANCTGLKNYGAYYENWWAYPKGWKDTAKSGADGNTGAPYGGIYSPEDTVFVDNGAMHVKMFRPSSGGDNHVAAMVPRKCMDTQYGRYVERFKVVKADPGFKSAHLFYGNGLEVDYPEGDYTKGLSAFTHPGENNFHTNAKWTEWHTTAIERTKGQVKYYLDGKLIGTATKSIPDIKLSWILQNESSIEGPYAANGATAQIDFDWVTCYAPAN